MSPSAQPYVVQIPSGLARRARELVERRSTAYLDLSELLVVALENQLALEERPPPGAVGTGDDPTGAEHAGRNDEEDRAILELLRKPSAVGPNVVTAASASTGKSLFALTNRLSPVALGARVLVNMVEQGAPPSVAEFAAEAGRCAREVGLRLRAEERQERVPASQRRSIGWPVGSDEQKTLDRFIWAFLVHSPDDPDRGAMAELGLASVVENKVLPTRRGLELAIAPSPILDGVPGWTLSAEQQEILRSCLLDMPEELKEVVAAIDNAISVTQSVVDRSIRSAHPHWTDNQLVAQRAAVLGRLRELNVLEVEGRGPKAMVTMNASAEDFVKNVLDRVKGKAA